MDCEKRNKRLRLLVRGVNRERKKQAQKIDLLCNDFIAAQKEFIKKLDTIAFAANFYKSIVGMTDLNSVLYTADKLIKEEIGDMSVAFFLRREKNFELHIYESDHPINIETENLERCFTPELVDNVCEANKLCSLEDLLEMGLQDNPTELNKISSVTVPLGGAGTCLGFILLYRSSENKLSADKLNNICAVSSGLSQAISCCQMLVQSAD